MQRLICISIHTPHAGSDSNLLPSLDRFSNFNPHSPCGERRFTSGIVHSCFVISIHTPHAGSDRWAVGVRHCRSHFNPHSPCGERLKIKLCYLIGFEFQSTLPMRGATIAFCGSTRTALYFNPHSPCGERHLCTAPIAGVTYFNPHSPCGERPGSGRYGGCGKDISIHTPHAGSDRLRHLQKHRQHKFQSTLPMRGATWIPKTSLGKKLVISIHTPHAGSDLFSERLHKVWKISIHTPHAGSDVKTAEQISNHLDFNPHSPCGERQRYVWLVSLAMYFNPHSPCGERRSSS